MKQWPKIGSKVTFKGLHMFWFTNIVEAANKLLEFDVEYTIKEIKLASSWCSVTLEEFPDQQFALSFFHYPRELTTEEVMQIEKAAWETVKYEFTSLEELRNRKRIKSDK